MEEPKLKAAGAESSGDEWDDEREASNSRLESEGDGSEGEGLTSARSELNAEEPSSADEEGVRDFKKEKRRRRRRKSKKPKEDGDKDTLPSPSEELMLPVEESDARYTAAIEALRANDEMCMWVQLPRCRLTDKKARKLCDAMRENHTVTSIDVSDNFISDDGARSLAALLASGAVPDLIALNVRGNPLSEKGKGALGSMRHARKLVKIDLEEEPPPEDQGYNEKMPKRGSNGWHMGAGGGGSGPGANGWEGTPTTFSRESKAEKAVPPQQRVEAALKAIKESADPVDSRALAQAIAAVVKAVSQELREDAPKRVRTASLEQLPPGLSMVAMNLPTFASVLSMDPPPIASQRKRAEPATGAHRIALVDLVHRLLLSSCQAIDDALLKEGVVTGAVALLFRFPWNSCLHASVARLVEVALCRPSSELCASLFKGEDSVLERLAAGGSAGAALKASQRLGDVGYIINLSKAVLSAAGSHHHLQALLSGSERWTEFVGGPLKVLLEEQAGSLGGPRPTVDTSPMAGVLDSEQDQGTALLEQLKALYLGLSGGARAKAASGSG